jgi:NAD(P)-dependent dehydrogenase (short-subunit alcohol dehydrogenase family)
MNEETTLTGKVALITGASKGLGKALSLELGRRGARLVMVARGESALDRAAAEVRRETGAVAVPLAFDVADKHATHVIAAMAAELGGEVDVLVHNASALGPLPMPLLFDLDCEDLAAVLETNVVGPFRLTKAVAGSMALRQRGTIVFLSSDAAVNAYPGWGAYGLSKAAADHMARTLAVELETHGVRSFSVDPTDMDTEMHALALPESDPSTLARPEAIARVIADMIERPERAKSGERLNAAHWSGA